jgi:acyl homoserine lactone synthase
MITCVTYDNLEFTAAAFRAQFALRHKCFIERQSYRVQTYHRREYDQYDNPASVYLVYNDPAGHALGVSRLMPVSHRCMLKDLWPDMVEDPHVLSAPHVWEGTRFCVDKDIEPALRRRVAQELVIAYLEFGLQNGVRRIVGLMPRLVLRTVFKASGIDVDYLGPPKDIDGVLIQAAGMDISHRQLEQARKITGIARGVLEAGSVAIFSAAA